MFSFLKKNRKVVIQDEIGDDVKISDKKVELKKGYVREVLENKKLPIVLLDPLWYTVKEQIKSNIITENEKKLQGLLKEQARLNTDYKEYVKVKQNFLKQILDLSGQVQDENSTKKIEELNKLHQSTLEVNNRLEEIEKRLEEVDEEVIATNNALVEEMVAVGYEYIELHRLKEIKLEAEIAELREEMLQKTNEKKQSEKFLKDIYNYLHNIVGQQQIEIIDKTLGDTK
ncbi:hypothetical protein [Cellulosilyticum ruminicola]|uniref:hypothetical protein n=1 Tax=Cellulosilyticum ruminicola TaxID=425254 RepID=UPI0006CFBDD3|nr:hypothetical protein [Cellulosilyticum ruminicola]